MERRANSIGREILEQMGGLRRLSSMLGIKQWGFTPRGVWFMWPNRQRSRGNYVAVTLRGDDTYDMEFFNVSMRGKKPVKKYQQVYNDQLVPIFESQTGWRTSLGRRASAPFVSIEHGYVTVRVLPRQLQVAVQHKQGQPPYLRDAPGNEARKWFVLTEKLAQKLRREGWDVDFGRMSILTVPYPVGLPGTGKWGEPQTFVIYLTEDVPLTGDTWESRAAQKDLRAAAKSLGLAVYTGPKGQWPIEAEGRPPSRR